MYQLIKDGLKTAIFNPDTWMILILEFSLLIFIIMAYKAGNFEIPLPNKEKLTFLILPIIVTISFMAYIIGRCVIAHKKIHE